MKYEYESELTKSFWTFVAGQLLAQPKCAPKNCKKKCKYKKMCSLAIGILSED